MNRAVVLGSLSNKVKLLLIVFMGLLSFLTGCSRAKLVEGGLYATPGEKGGYSVFKILKLDDRGVHVRLFSNHFSARPKIVDESTLYLAGMDRKSGESLGMGHAPISNRSFADWQVTFVQQSTVKEEELAGYKMWLEANGGYFCREGPSQSNRYRLLLAAACLPSVRLRP